MFDLKGNKARIKMSGILLGVSISLLLFLLGLVIVALIVNFFSITSAATNKIMFVVNYGVVFIGGVIAAYTSQNRGWLNGGVVGLVYVLLLVAMGSLCTSLVFSGSLLLKVLTICMVSALGGIIGINMV